ncbi:MAG: isocyanide synthase family protein [Polyangiaceae bacterium]|jgi:pyoverdine/dityrosine biosynthesis protein Dit1|nr:isocyanide synthase family protein [Polyangiaceae bacterium]
MNTPDETPSADVRKVSESILSMLLPFRREEHPEHHENVRCFGPQLEQIGHFVGAGEELLFTLPAFPCKSPNTRKVLGHLPDLGELLSLRFLAQLCEDVGSVYAPGARLLICSDGHVFGDLVRVPDDHITEYTAVLREMIDLEGRGRLEVFNLDDVYGDLGYDEKRARLTAEYATSIDAIRAEVRADERALAMYRGMTRFMFEDALSPAYAGSRAALLRDSRHRAYGVIQRSRAWSDLIDRRLRGSVRLSIHPQACGTPKFGIRLLDIDDSWLTPWHSVAVRAGSRVTLMKRAEAEQVGRLVFAQERLGHFVLERLPVRAPRGADEAAERAPSSAHLRAAAPVPL